MENSLPPEILWKIISLLIAIIVFLFTSAGGVFGFLHRQLRRELQGIHEDLKPMVTKVELHGQRLEDVVKRLDEHGRRISELEKKK